MSRYAIRASDIYSAAESFRETSGFPFQRRESGQQGLYCLFKHPEGRGRLLVIENIDPAFRPELDSPEFKCFEPSLPRERVFVDVDAVRPDDFAMWHELIQRTFPDGIQIRWPRFPAGE
jgi:hypothetical protein